MIVPRSIGQRIGLFDIGGGRSLLWFADLDTIVFDLAIVASAVWIFRVRRSRLRNPVFWSVIAVAIATALPLAYSVTNFGTLFRLRGMIYLGIVLIPLALSTTQSEADAALPAATQ
jgi:hypothetical protein